MLILKLPYHCTQALVLFILYPFVDDIGVFVWCRRILNLSGVVYRWMMYKMSHFFFSDCATNSPPICLWWLKFNLQIFITDACTNVDHRRGEGLCLNDQLSIETNCNKVL